MQMLHLKKKERKGHLRPFKNPTKAGSLKGIVHPKLKFCYQLITLKLFQTCMNLNSLWPPLTSIVWRWKTSQWGPHQLF